MRCLSSVKVYCWGLGRRSSVLLMALKRCREGNPIQTALQKPHLNYINDTLLIDQLDNLVGRAAILCTGIVRLSKDQKRMYGIRCMPSPSAPVRQRDAQYLYKLLTMAYSWQSTFVLYPPPPIGLSVDPVYRGAKDFGFVANPGCYDSFYRSLWGKWIR